MIEEPVTHDQAHVEAAQIAPALPAQIAGPSRRDRLAWLVACPACGAPSGEPCMKRTSSVIRVPCANPHAERKRAAEEERSAERSGDRAESEVDEGLRQRPLARTIEYALVALGRRAKLVRESSHAGECPSCEDGEVWTEIPLSALGDEADDEADEIHEVHEVHEAHKTDADRLRFSEQREEEPEAERRSLGACPVCNGIGWVGCGFVGCKERECR